MDKKTIRNLVPPPFLPVKAEVRSAPEDDPAGQTTLRDLVPPFRELRSEVEEEWAQSPAAPAFRTPDEKLLRAGDRVGAYLIEGVIDPGGEVARVYKARHSFTDRVVALKVLLTRHAGRQDLMEKMRREAVALSTLSHPNVVALLDANIHDELVWMVLEYVEGPTCRDLINRTGGLPLDKALTIVREVGEGLTAAHEHGILHLDVKPENVILSPTGTKVLDLGSAQFLSGSNPATGEVAGTPEYMAPERFARGSVPDVRADVYSFGVFIYELVTGRHPIILKQGLSDEQIEWLQCRMAPTMAPQFPFQIWEVVALMLSKDPERRPRSVRDCLALLEKARTEVRGAVKVPTRLEFGARPWIPGSVALGALAGLAVGLGLLWLVPRSGAGGTAAHSAAVAPADVAAVSVTSFAASPPDSQGPLQSPAMPVPPPRTVQNPLEVPATPAPGVTQAGSSRVSTPSRVARPTDAKPSPSPARALKSVGSGLDAPNTGKLPIWGIDDNFNKTRRGTGGSATTDKVPF